MPRTPRDCYSLVLFLLPHAGLPTEAYARVRRAMLALLAPLGGPCAVAIASEISPRAVRSVIRDLLDEAAAREDAEVVSVVEVAA